jgi:enolase-phosphatase E1
VASFLRDHASDAAVADDAARLRAEHAADAAAGLRPPPLADNTAGVAPYVLWLMEQDRKSTGLKALQGRIWLEGYERGALRGVLYDDVAPAFRRWRARGLRLAIFSSGSVLAQRLIFSRSNAGDLTPFLEAYFDTTAGPKREAASYRGIAETLALAPTRVLFLSDVEAELDAARAAGMATALSQRPGVPPPKTSSHPGFATFATVFA